MGIYAWVVKARLDLERDLATGFLGTFGARLVRTRGKRRRWWGRRGKDGVALPGDDRLLASREPAAPNELATVS